MQSRSGPLVLLIGVLVLAANASAGAVGYYGWEPEFWDNHAVAIASVSQVKPANDPGGRRLLIVNASVSEVLATDSALPCTLSFKFYPWTDLGSGHIVEEPAAGMTYLLCLERQGNDWTLLMNYFGLFESGTMMQPVKNADDRLVLRAERNIAWARAKSFALRFESEEARKSATSEPQPAPKRPTP